MARFSALDDDGSLESDDTLTFFGQLADEKAEEAEATSSGVLANIFGRFWKADTPANPEASLNNTCLESTVLEDFDQKFTCTIVSSSNGTKNNVDEEHVVQNPSCESPCRPGTFQGGVSSSGISNSQESQRKFSDKLSNFFKSGSKLGLMDYNRSNFRQYWMPDSTGKECYQCEERFTAFRRRHHCRLCGQIFCARCCNIHVPGSALGYVGDLRLCHYCAKMMAHYLPAESDSCKLSEDVGSVGQLQFNQPQPLQGSVDENHCLLEQQLSTVATVSAGSLVWSRPSDIGSVTPERKNSLSLPPPSYKPPTMLCVQELYLQHERQTQVAKRQRNVSSTLQEEDESGPDWFRNMDPSTNAVMKEDTKDDVGELILDCQFDPFPLGVEVDVSSESLLGGTSNVQQLDQRASVTLSPSKSASYFDDDIDKSFDRRSERMLSYLFERERIDDMRWKPVILKLARNIANTMKIDVAKRRDSMNILTYVHVKKLVIEKEESSAEISIGFIPHEIRFYNR